MKYNELQKYNIIRDGIIFTPLTQCKVTKDNNGNTQYEHTIIKSADEVYQKYLENKDKIIEKEPTTEELLIKEIANLKVEIMQMKGGIK